MHVLLDPGGWRHRSLRARTWSIHLLANHQEDRMSTRVNVEIPDELKAVMDEIALSKQITMTDVFRQALGLYIASVEGARRGEKLGMFRQANGELEVTTEIVGL